MRPYRIGTSSGTRVLACSWRMATGSGRSGGGSHCAWLTRGTWPRWSRPRCRHSSGLSSSRGGARTPGDILVIRPTPDRRRADLTGAPFTCIREAHGQIKARSPAIRPGSGPASRRVVRSSSVTPVDSFISHASKTTANEKLQVSHGVAAASTWKRAALTPQAAGHPIQRCCQEVWDLALLLYLVRKRDPTPAPPRPGGPTKGAPAMSYTDTRPVTGTRPASDTG